MTAQELFEVIYDQSPAWQKWGSRQIVCVYDCTANEFNLSKFFELMKYEPLDVLGLLANIIDEEFGEPVTGIVMSPDLLHILRDQTGQPAPTHTFRGVPIVARAKWSSHASQIEYGIHPYITVGSEKQELTVYFTGDCTHFYRTSLAKLVRRGACALTN